MTDIAKQLWTHLATEAVVRRCSLKKMFLKNLKNSQENTLFIENL